MRSQGGSLGTEAVNPIATCNVSVHAVANKSAVSFGSQCHMLNVSVSEVVFFLHLALTASFLLTAEMK